VPADGAASASAASPSSVMAGRVVVVVGDDATRAGDAARVLNDAGARAVVFLGDPAQDGAALTEMVAELFPAVDDGTPEPA
jgi:hypothetical protein